ncbi:MAG: 6-hydroxymethylpterin diphosphokinase MptE-like protein [Nitrososphaerota archaeon]
MELRRWLEIYSDICEILGLDPGMDMESARVLAALLKGRCLTYSQHKTLLDTSDSVVIFGAGPSLLRDLDEAIPFLSGSKTVKVAADGACRAFLERGLTPDVVVTDLDGGEDCLTECSERGSLMVVHAHGHNIDLIRSIVPKLKGWIVGTTQTVPIQPLENFGGFTDGDRAICMFEELGFRHILVAGMDFGEEVGPYSKPHHLDGENLARKRLKLKIGLQICSSLAERTKSRCYDLTSDSHGIPGFIKSSWADLREILMSGGARR